MQRLLEHKPDLTLPELRQAAGLRCTLPAIHYVLKKMGLTYRKTLHASEQDRADIQQARRRWQRQQTRWDPARLVFLDESGAKTNMTRLRGRAPRGQRVCASAPAGHWQTTTMISSIRLNGSTAALASVTRQDAANWFAHCGYSFS
jgi:hypothetical protein